MGHMGPWQTSDEDRRNVTIKSETDSRDIAIGVRAMELAATHLVWGAILIFLPSFIIFLQKWKHSAQTRRPPGPPGWPVLGNLLDLGTMPHQSLAAFGQKYGPVIWLRLGSVNTMAILSANAATEFFKNHDVDFSDRFVPLTSRIHDYYQNSLALCPYGPFWRAMRRVLSVEILVNRRINETATMRRSYLEQMLAWIEEEAGRDKSGKGIQVGKMMSLTSYSVLGKQILSRDFQDPTKAGKKLYEVVKRMLALTGDPNMADYFPFLKNWDLQGLHSKFEIEFGKGIEMAAKLVRERVKEKQKLEEDIKHKDFLDVLLEFEGTGKEEPAKFSEKDVAVFTLEILMAGAESTASTIEWAMAELLRNPETMIKAKAELAAVAGPNRKIEESDIEKLPYLQGVIKEALRLHPILPFLIPRIAVKDTVFMGFDVPKDTQVFVNAWSIGRDPEIWEEPHSFKPERFMGSKVEFKGQEVKLIPFGAGRRMCPGVPLAHRMLHMGLGYLIQHFEWELGEGITPATVDMEDQMGVNMKMRRPLLAVPKKCV